MPTPEITQLDHVSAGFISLLKLLNFEKHYEIWVSLASAR
jgi:hypothetical protein